MKNKRLIVLLCVLAFMTVLVVLNSTLFTLQSVSINWLTSKCELQNVKDYDLTGEVYTGQSIFLVNKNQISEKLEKDFPYLNIVSIETKFPNKIVIHSAERESLYAVNMSSDKYAILDEKGKVLDIITGKELDANSEGGLRPRPIVVNFGNTAISSDEFVVGEFVKISKLEEIINSLSYSLRASNYIPTTSKGVINNIEINTTSKYATLTTRSGISLVIINFEELLTDKLKHAFNRYNVLHNQGAVDCSIEVCYNSVDNLIYSEIIW